MASASLLQALRSRRFAWLLGLALLLPAAQWVAAAHVLQHVQHKAGGGTELPDTLTACHTCVAAACLHAAAPLPTVVAPPVHSVPQAAPLTCPAGIVGAGAPLSYRSRAPPLLHA